MDRGEERARSGVESFIGLCPRPRGLIGVAVGVDDPEPGRLGLITEPEPVRRGEPHGMAECDRRGGTIFFGDSLKPDVPPPPLGVAAPEPGRFGLIGRSNDLFLARP